MVDGHSGAATAELPTRPAIAQFASLLALAVQRHHTYPASSPLCEEAIRSCQEALLSIAAPEQLVLRVTPRRLYLDETPVEGGALLHPEVVRRLHRCGVLTLTIDREATADDLAQLCIELVRRDELGRLGETLADALERLGVDKVRATVVERVVVLDAGNARGSDAATVQRERKRRARARAGGFRKATGHLYPADRGRVRLDPECDLESVDFADLGVLVDDPLTLADMLRRLSGDEISDDPGPHALEEKFTEVASMYASLSPRLADRLIGDLARAVLELEPERRRLLLRNVVMPGLVDGRVDATVLRHFPDDDLADALALFLDLEIAGPEMLALAIHRLGIPAERQAVLRALLKHRASPAWRSAWEGHREQDAHNGALHIDPDSKTDFREFAALDLALDASTEADLDDIRARVAQLDPQIDQIRCLWDLVRLEPNPQLAERLLERAGPLLGALRRHRRWEELALWVGRFRDTARAASDERPRLAELIAMHLRELCSTDLLRELVRLADEGEAGLQVAGRVLAAFGETAVPALIAALDAEGSRQGRRSLVRLMCGEAPTLAPGLEHELDHPQWFVVRNLLRVLGFAGPGYEMPIADQLVHPERRVVREAFQSLARIGTPQAAGIVARELETGDVETRRTAEEMLWRFPAPMACAESLRLLSRQDFVVDDPGLACRMLERTVDRTATGSAPDGADADLHAVLGALAPLRYRVWRPSLARLGRRARSCSRRRP